MTFLYKPDVETLQELVADKLVSCKKHPTEDLYIYNYTAECQYRSAWGPHTLAARGLILDGDGNVVARPFQKFFNVEEHSRSDILWTKPHVVHAKQDGSLGILYPCGAGYAIATRGSFESKQAIHGTTMLQRVIDETGFTPHPDYTYLFEIIYPDNRIVVNYGDREELVFLGAVHKETGSTAWTFDDMHDWPGSTAPLFDTGNAKPKDYGHLFAEENAEGFVLYFPHGNTRVKVKFEDYKRLHKLVFGLSTKSIWESLMKREELGDMLKRIPDEFNDWARKAIAELSEARNDIMNRALAHYKQVEREVRFKFGSPNKFRREFAELANKNREFAPLCFMFLDGDQNALWDYSWKMVKPKQAVFFSEEKEDQ